MGADERPVRRDRQQLLADLSGGDRLSVESRSRLDSTLRVITALDFEIELFAKLVNSRLRTDPGYRAIQQIPGIGPVLAGVFVAEIGDISRFQRHEQLASWAGLTPKHRESDTTVHRGRITKQGSRLVRWAAVEAVQRVGGHTRIGQHRDRVAARRGRNIGVEAAARELLTWCFTGCAITTSAPSPPRSRHRYLCQRRWHETTPQRWWARVVQVMTPTADSVVAPSD
jgi:transposase